MMSNRSLPPFIVLNSSVAEGSNFFFFKPSTLDRGLEDLQFKFVENTKRYVPRDLDVLYRSEVLIDVTKPSFGSRNFKKLPTIQ